MALRAFSPLTPTQWAPTAQVSRVAAVVCAKDEAQRIGPVLDVLVRKVPTLVVNDGSSDATALVAQGRGASVLNLPQNVGKGQAMLAGVNAVPYADVILFMDADLIGLRPEHIDQLLGSVLNGSYGMVVGMQDYGAPLNEVVRKLPLISDQRAVRREILARMPPQAWQGYAVETWMNRAASACNPAQSWCQPEPVATTLLRGLTHVLKWEKQDQGAGFANMVNMGAEVIGAHVQAAIWPNSTARWPTRPPLLAGQALPPKAGPPAVGLTRNSGSAGIMRALSNTLVETGGPYIRDHLWTPAAQERVGDAIGRRLSLPLWSIACVACAGFFGPTAGLAATIGALAINHRSFLTRKGSF